MDQNRMTPKDFFVHVGMIIALYVATFSLLNLLFTVITIAFPAVTSEYYYSPSISWPVAALIIVFPLFLILSWLLAKSYRAMPSKRDLGIRKWLVFITLFVSGIVIAADLVTLLYYFLEGQDITTAFVLKVLVVLVITGGIFWHYLADIRNILSSKAYTISAWVAIIVVLASITVGFAIMGSPMTQRLQKTDMIRVGDLQNIQYDVLNYWQQKQKLPPTLADLTDQFSGSTVPTDPETGASYEYKILSPLSFELCATFGAKIRKGQPGTLDFYGVRENNWQHEAGRQCFTRTIDPELYPPVKR